MLTIACRGQITDSLPATDFIVFLSELMTMLVSLAQHQAPFQTSSVHYWKSGIYYTVFVMYTIKCSVTRSISYMYAALIMALN